MIDDKKLRESLCGLIGSAAQANDFEIIHATLYSAKPRVIDYIYRNLPPNGDQEHYELEINVYGPASDSDTVEAVSARISSGLHGVFQLEQEFAYYMYKENRNQLSNGDGHSARYRLTFDMYLYERS